MLITVLVLLAVLSVPLTGGTYARLALIRLNWWFLLPVILAVQIVVLETSWLPPGGSAVLHVASYVLAGAVIVRNIYLPGLWLLSLGAASNAVAIIANNGTLPASPNALRAAGIEADGEFVNSGVMAEARLWWLGDVFAVPSWLPLANVYSIGDVCIVAGAFWIAHSAAHRPAVPRGRHAQDVPAHASRQ